MEHTREPHGAIETLATHAAGPVYQGTGEETVVPLRVAGQTEGHVLGEIPPTLDLILCSRYIDGRRRADGRKTDEDGSESADDEQDERRHQEGENLR